MNQLHLFNPGHELSVLHGTKSYTFSANVKKMQEELALLPLWYADKDDYVFAEGCESFIDSLHEKGLKQFPKAVDWQWLKNNKTNLPPLEAAPWGLSPESIRFFTNLSRTSGAEIHIPEWKNDYAKLTSRESSFACLETIKAELPDRDLPMTPIVCKNLEEINHYIQTNGTPAVVKMPFSSSGRGILWLNGLLLKPLETKWIEGALKRQGFVSIEPTFNKQYDFAMEFRTDGLGNVSFEGFSFFLTDQNGAYQGNLLGEQEIIRQSIAENLGVSALEETKIVALAAVAKNYANCYSGYLGIDMMDYFNSKGKHAIHPCVEVNLRRTMGLVAISISRNFLAKGAKGLFNITFDAALGEALKRDLSNRKTYGLQLENKRIKSGYLALCPVTSDTHYTAYIKVS